MGEKETDAGVAERKDSGIRGQASEAGMPSYREAAGGGGISHEDDWHDQAKASSGGGQGKSEIAIGDPGVNGNLTDSPSEVREGGISHEDDWHDQAKASSGGPVKSEIAIGDPGVNENVAGIAVSDEGTPGKKSGTKSS